MAQATVKTVQYLDPRIEPQPDPVYDYVIGPTQNQYYRIPASGFSQNSITFNNLTTLGVDRAYLDTFEIELSADITFAVVDAGRDVSGGGAAQPDYRGYFERPVEGAAWADSQFFAPDFGDWTFQSFPFNTCCEEARVNINGGAFFSQPMTYVRAKERYMNQYELSKSYQNICPVHRPELQYESGRRYDKVALYNNQTMSTVGPLSSMNSRYRSQHTLYTQSTEGICGGDNMSFINLSALNDGTSMGNITYETRHNHTEGLTYVTFKNIHWREPLFVSPFSSRYDATYGRPLYNITSMDLAFNLCSDLGNMIRVMNWRTGSCTDGVAAAGPIENLMRPGMIRNYKVELKNASLCYQVMTIPPILNKPLTTLVPYRRFVPFITEYNHQFHSGATSGLAANSVNVNGETITISSGVYTFNEIPTAIWLFVAPVKSRYQENQVDLYKHGDAAYNSQVYNNAVNVTYGNWDSNKLFAYITGVNLSMANTTQILATAKPADLYRIAKANGCEDSAESWLNSGTVSSHIPFVCPLHLDNDAVVKAKPPFDTTLGANARAFAVTTTMWQTQNGMAKYEYMSQRFGAGSVLRLKPGVDIVVPDQPLIPGANANNMIFQATVTANTPPNSMAQTKYALWMLFEYVGVAAISPGQCEITMNPLGSGEIMAVSPVMSATSEETEGKVEGSGFWDSVKKHSRIAAQLADDGIISMILKRIPGAQGAEKWAKKHGLGEPMAKKARGGACDGGAVIGRGLNDWV
jgi:hypothetical protein